MQHWKFIKLYVIYFYKNKKKFTRQEDKNESKQWFDLIFHSEILSLNTYLYINKQSNKLNI